MNRVWSGENPVDGAGPVGPEPIQSGGPELLIGAFAPAAIQRAGRWADGYLGGGGDPQAALAMYNTVVEEWENYSRDGSPRFVATNAFALGPDAADRGAAQYRHYNQFLGPEAADQAARRVLTTSEEICQFILNNLDSLKDLVLVAGAGNHHLATAENQADNLWIIKAINQSGELLGFVFDLVERQVEGQMVEI